VFLILIVFFEVYLACFYEIQYEESKDMSILDQ